MTVQNPTWISLGNNPTLINPDWASPTGILADTTFAEANVVVGWNFMASGMQGVSVSGNATAFGGVNFARGQDVLTYSLDGGVTSTTEVYVSHVVVNVQVTTIDAVTQVQSTSLLRGVIIQMENGDLFMRPFFTDTAAWNSALGDPNTQIFRIEVLSVASTLGPSATDAFSDSLNGAATFTPSLFAGDVFACFTRGTMILTDRGDIAVQDLRRGDLVQTADHGLQPVRWIGSKVISSASLALKPQMRPIRIAAGVLGQGLPNNDLVVSQQHRMLVVSKIALRMFDRNEVLVAAKQLLAVEGIEVVEDLVEVEYFHFLFDQHEVVFAEGAPTESLFTGKEALKSLPPESVREIMTIFPELLNHDPARVPVAARFLPLGRSGRKLAERHRKIGRDLLVAWPHPDRKQLKNLESLAKSR